MGLSRQCLISHIPKTYKDHQGLKRNPGNQGGQLSYLITHKSVPIMVRLFMWIPVFSFNLFQSMEEYWPPNLFSTRGLESLLQILFLVIKMCILILSLMKSRAWLLKLSIFKQMVFLYFFVEFLCIWGVMSLKLERTL